MHEALTQSAGSGSEAPAAPPRRREAEEAVPWVGSLAAPAAGGLHCELQGLVVGGGEAPEYTDCGAL